MDSFVKHFFPKFSTPGARFAFDAMPATWTYMSGDVVVSTDGYTTNVPKTVYQRMTPLGRVSARLEEVATVFDGLSKNYLSPEGTLKMEAINQYLKTSGGMSATDASKHIALTQSIGWKDNHVALLLNMLRYVFLMKIRETRGNLNGALGLFEEEGMSIDMDQWFDQGYPREAAFTAWPVQPVMGRDGHGNEVRIFTEIHRLVEAAPDMEHSAVDLRACGSAGTLFILKMLNAWQRSTRMKLDFALPSLAEVIYYRGSDVTSAYEAWAQQTEGWDRTMATSAQAWTYLKQYVTQNRLYDHFSTALHLFCTLSYQYVPETAEGTYWAGLELEAVIPAFHSIRGRYVFLNSDEAAFLNQRPLDEWNYLSGKLEKLNLMALVWSQAFYMGYAIRSTRRGLENEPNDLDNTAADFDNADRRVAAAVAEFTRVATPLPGMSGVYVKFTEDIDMYDPERKVQTRSDDTDDYPSSHSYVREFTTAKPVGPTYTNPNTWLDSRPDKATAIQKMEAMTRALTRAQEVMADIDLGRDFTEAAAGRMLDEDPPEGRRLMQFVTVPLMPFPGYPTLLVPLNPTSYPTPFNLEGVIEGSLGELTKNTLRVSLTDAWRVQSFLHSVGYTTTYRIEGEPVGPDEFVSGATSEEVWPIVYEPEMVHAKVVFTGQERQVGTRLVLPPVHSHYIKNCKIAYKTEVKYRGVSDSGDRMQHHIQDMGGVTNYHGVVVTVSGTFADKVKEMRGYYLRGDQDFRFAEYVTGGMIPDPSGNRDQPPQGPHAEEENVEGAAA